jgi:formate--tetrahydrofolate ligase
VTTVGGFAPLRSDIEIAQASTLEPIAAIAAKIGIAPEAFEPYGRHRAKLALDWVARQPERPVSRLVLVTAISPTPAGEGKTTTTVGLGDALASLGRRTVICVREPSMGPVFGMKGGATGGGHAQVVPMEEINLHFTGDFAAISQAHNLLSALLDNHIHHGNALRIDARRIRWPRVIDVNDRALRDIVVGLGGPANGFVREDRFDIVVASEVMAILCLANDIPDLKRRLGAVVVGHSFDGRPVTARDLKADGAMAALLRDAIKPNLVQTLEGTPALVHGGPFANIAHGCNSVVATRAGLRLADYVVTEAGFGADLGAEKFINIKCRAAGLVPDCVVVVATIRALKYHGGAALERLGVEDLGALEAGLPNLIRHVRNMTEGFGRRCVVALNHRTEDTAGEIALLGDRLRDLGVGMVVARHWAEGGRGAVDLAREVVALCDAEAADPKPLAFTYPDDASLADKIGAIATSLYGAERVHFDDRVRRQLAELEAAGHGRLPVCVAKTQSSFSGDPQRRGAPSGHVLTVREVRLAAGAGFVVMVCGDMLTMPGLPRIPAAEHIGLSDDGTITGLS